MKTLLPGAVGLCILLASCARILDVPTPYIGDKLVIFGVLTPDSIPSLRITRTYPTTGKLDVKTSAITNASVYLFENRTVIGQLIHQQNGVYLAPERLKIEIGKSYSYSVTAPNFPAVETDYETVPALPSSFSVRLGESIRSPLNGSNPTRKIHITFKDDPNTTDFYSIQLEEFTNGLPIVFNTFGLDRPDDIEDGCGFRSRNRQNEYNVSDLCFSGGMGQLTVGAELRGTGRAGAIRGRPVNADRMVATLRRTNRGYQEYNRTFYVESDDPFQAFEPPNVRYSNVKGGYGFIGFYSQLRVAVTLAP